MALLDICYIHLVVRICVIGVVRTFSKGAVLMSILKEGFGSGQNIEIGDYSGIGINAHIPSDTVIGKYVMMGPNCFILDTNHIVSDTSQPMCFQGMAKRKQTIIEDDVWIGRDVKMTPGRHISKGTIVAMCCVLTKDFPPFSIVGGNPSKMIKSRICR